VFPSETGKLRDRSKTQADVPEVFAFCALTGISSHAFRRTMASLLDESGLTARMIADQLGMLSRR
jgi:integrase